MISFILIVFSLSLILYAVFAGADFGAGMIEYFAHRNRRIEDEKLISHAMAPVWEANHVWIILSVVILFTAFPAAFSEIVTIFHLPLLLMLIGIILRGCAFTFRHYDPFYDGNQQLYSRIFIFSSFLTPLAQGLVVGGCMLGRIPPGATDFVDVYILPWCNVFCLCVGIFLSTLYFFLAAVFLIGETKDPATQDRFRRRSVSGLLAVLLSTTLVFGSAENSGFHLYLLYSSGFPFLGVLLAAVTLIWFLHLLAIKKIYFLRVPAALFVGIVVGTWFLAAFPFAIGGHPYAFRSLNLLAGTAPEATLRQLTIALIVGTLLIFPSLGYLLYVFKHPRA